MKLERDPIDSELLGFGVYNLTGFSLGDDLPMALSMIPERHSYVVCKLPSEKITEIHCLEAHGFRFSEFQLDLRYTINGPLTVPKQFDFIRATEDDVPALQACSDEAFEDDRMRRDPRVSPAIALTRYRGYIERAFRNPSQRIYKTVLKSTGELVAFKSHRLDSPTAATLLLGAVAKKFQNSGAGLVNSRFEVNELRSLGIKNVRTKVSATNHRIINLEVLSLGFAVTASTVVLAYSNWAGHANCI